MTKKLFMFCFDLLRHFGICPILVLKLAAAVFTGLYLWAL